MSRRKHFIKSLTATRAEIMHSQRLWKPPGKLKERFIQCCDTVLCVTEGHPACENLYHLSPKVLFQYRWTKKTKREPANQVHLENGHEHMDSQVVIEARKTHTQWSVAVVQLNPGQPAARLPINFPAPATWKETFDSKLHRFVTDWLPSLSPKSTASKLRRELKTLTQNRENHPWPHPWLVNSLLKNSLTPNSRQFKLSQSFVVSVNSASCIFRSEAKKTFVSDSRYSVQAYKWQLMPCNVASCTETTCKASTVTHKTTAKVLLSYRRTSCFQQMHKNSYISTTQ